MINYHYYRCSWYAESWADSRTVMVLLAPNATVAKAVIREGHPDAKVITIEMMEVQP